ncbi:MAG: BatD family protein, partial [Verrucomicrobiae bacterium]|nr:BatD family protein [Verrucomicrobiae bacterium]
MNRTLQPPEVLGGFLLLAGMLLCGDLRGQEAKVRTSTEGADAVWTGQKVTLVVELLAPGYFSGAPSFDLPGPQGVLLVPPVDHPVVGRETVGDTDYTVQRHELFAYPMRAGDLTIPAVGVRFAFKRAPLDANTIAAAMATQPQPLEVKTPPGAEKLGQVISARDLKLEESWKPEPGRTDILAGAAFTRTVTFTAPDVPGMVFPPFPTGDIAGLGIYAKHNLLDQSDRGTMQGKRQDTITYLCERPGHFTIPATRFIWFDLAGRQLRTNDLPARTLNVVANAAYASTTEAT